MSLCKGLLGWGRGLSRPLLVWDPSGLPSVAFPVSIPCHRSPSPVLLQHISIKCIPLCYCRLTCFPLHPHQKFTEERIHFLLDFLSLISITLPERLLYESWKSELALVRPWQTLQPFLGFRALNIVHLRHQRYKIKLRRFQMYRPGRMSP